jgi:chromosome segregation ATPase
MLGFIRKLLAPTPNALESRQDALQREISALRGDFTGWELRLSELVTRLSNQLRRLSQLEKAAQRRQEQEEEDDLEGGESSIDETLRRLRNL